MPFVGQSYHKNNLIHQLNERHVRKMGSKTHETPGTPGRPGSLVPRPPMTPKTTRTPGTPRIYLDPRDSRAKQVHCGCNFNLIVLTKIKLWN